jgi:hypothetical protein
MSFVDGVIEVLQAANEPITPQEIAGLLLSSGSQSCVGGARDSG